MQKTARAWLKSASAIFCPNCANVLAGCECAKYIKLDQFKQLC